jgi:hypothetical protein
MSEVLHVSWSDSEVPSWNQSLKVICFWISSWLTCKYRMNVNSIFFFCRVTLPWVHFVRRPLIGLLYQHQMIDVYGAFSGTKTGGGNRSTRRKPAPMPLCPPRIPPGLTWDRSPVAAVGSRRQTASAAARPIDTSNYGTEPVAHLAGLWLSSHWEEMSVNELFSHWIKYLCTVF